MTDYVAVCGAALDELRKRNLQPIEAIPTPWQGWNEACRGDGGQVGLAFGWHVVVGGKSGGGKTFVGCNLASHAMLMGQTVTFHSLEMTWNELATRHMAIVSGEPAWKLSRGKHFDPEAFDRAAYAMNMARAQLRLNKSPMGTLSETVEGITKAYEKTGSRLHIIDYLQLAWTGSAASRYERIMEISHAIRGLAKSLNVVTVAMSQMNRDGIKSPGKPQIEHLDGGGSLEQDSDQILLMDHSRKVPVANSEGRNRGWIGWALLKKNRHGEEPEIPIRFDSDSFRIRERMPDEIQDSEVERPLRAIR